MESLSLKVKVTDAYGMGHGYAGIDHPNVLNASVGDVLEIIGRRRTVAKYWNRNSPEDVGKGIIWVDVLVMINAGIEEEDTVIVRKINAVPAEKVTFTYSEPYHDDENHQLFHCLLTLPVIKGDYVVCPYFTSKENDFIIPGNRTLQVDSVTQAANVVVITKDTVFESRSGRTITENEVRPGQEKIFCDGCGAENMRFWYTLNRSDGTILRRLCVKCNSTGNADGV